MGDTLIETEDAFFKTVLHGIGDCVILTDPEGRVLLMNRPAETLTGWGESEAQGRPLGEVFHIVNEETLEEVESPVARVLREGVIVGLANHTLLLARDGRSTPIADSAAPVRDADGRLRGVVLVFRDQSAEREAQRKVAAARAFFEQIVATVREPLLVLDSDLKVVFANASFYRAFQVERQDTERRCVFDLGNGQWNIPALVELLKSVRDSNTVFEDFRVEHDFESIERRVMLLNARRIVAPQSEKPLILLAIEDVTEKERAQGQLRAEHAKYQAIMRSAPVAVLVFDSQEEIEEANSAAEALFQVKLADLDRRRCGNLLGCVHRQDSPLGCGFGPACAKCAIYASLRAGLAGSALSGREAVLMQEGHPEPRVWHLLCSASPISLENQRGGLLTLQDVTDLKRAQQERELAQASLAQADRLSSMGMLAAGVAHEINNPLSFVLYNLESLAEDLPRFTDLLRRGYDELSQRLPAEALAKLFQKDQFAPTPALLADIRDRVRDTLEGVTRIRRIVRGLSTFSRVEQSDEGPVHLSDPMEHALVMAQNELKYRARVVKDLLPVPAVRATEGKLAQVFLNLLVNAAHAIPEGHVADNEIRVRTWSEGDSVCAEVSDTGCGIAPENRQRVFKPFFTTKPSGRGSGLGLAISKNIIESLGGTIWFEARPERGTRFVIRLPRMQEPAASRAEQAAAPSPAASARARVLVIDDEPAVRKTIRRILETQHDVVLADSGEAAKQILQQDRRFDLLLCDLMMPHISGMELHAWLNQIDPACAARMVFITGGVFTPGAAEYLERTSNLRLEKPIETKVLRDIVEKAANRFPAPK
jgi:PAS domain S-box-containing protein